MNTLYISDLDGTLLNSCAELSDYTVNTLNHLIASGTHFSIATARTAATVLQMFEKVALNIPIILMNGVLVYDPIDKQYINRELLNGTITDKIIRAIRKTGQSGLMYALHEDELVAYYETLDRDILRDFVNERITKYNKIFTQIDDFADAPKVLHGKAIDIIYFCFLDKQENIEKIYSLVAEIDGIRIEKYRDNYAENLWFLEIFSANASKYNATQFIREHYGYDKIIGFGDNLNDIPLFRACDECYAVENAANEVKEVATAVIESNDDNAVAKWLQRQVQAPPSKKAATVK